MQTSSTSESKNMATDIAEERVENNAGLEVIGHAGNYEDHQGDIREALKAHRKAVIWAVYALFVLTISSYDNSASGIFLSVPAFRKDFGYEYAGNYVLPAKWQSAYSGGPSAT